LLYEKSALEKEGHFSAILAFGIGMVSEFVLK
jgi:hypothetical protein